MSKQTMSYKGYTGSWDISFEDGCLHGKILFIDDLITYEGENPHELEESFKAAVDRYLAYCEKTGKPANKPFSGTFQVRFGPERHKVIAQAAAAQGLPINEYLCNLVDKNTGSDDVNTNEEKQEVVVSKTGLSTKVATMDKQPKWEPAHARFH